MRVLLTGGASGLGAALLRACLARGDRVTVIDRLPRPEPPEAPEPALTWLRHDLGSTDPAAWAAVEAAVLEQGPFDLTLLNAGISATGRFESIPMPDHLQVSRVNLHAPLRLSMALHRGGALARGGRLVFVASLSCFTGYPGAASYAASKDGLAAFARSLRKPLRREGVSVQLLCPGPMDTPHAARHAPLGANPGRRILPERVAQRVLTASPRPFLLLCGPGAHLAATLGRIAPRTMTRIMGRVLFDRLKGPPPQPADTGSERR